MWLVGRSLAAVSARMPGAASQPRLHGIGSGLVAQYDLATSHVGPPQFQFLQGLWVSVLQWLQAGDFSLTKVLAPGGHFSP